MLIVPEDYFDLALGNESHPPKEPEIPAPIPPVPDHEVKIEQLNKEGDRRGAPGDPKDSGRSEGDTNLPPLIRGVVSRLAHFDTGHNVAQQIGVSHSQVQKLKHGEGAASLSPSQVDSFLEKAQEQAASKLLHTLGVISNDEIDAVPVKEKVFIADRLAGVVNKLGTRHGGSGTNVAVIFQTPTQRSESEYEVIEVSSESKS